MGGPIELLESFGIGSSIMVRGPPEAGFGAIIYNKDTNLTLEAQNGDIYAAQGVSLSAASLSLYANQIEFKGNITALNRVEFIALGDAYLTAGAGIYVQSGYVTILGKQVLLIDSIIDVSGPYGAGTVLIGGGFQGQGTTKNAAITLVNRNTYIYADATALGDGGRVIVWADQATHYYGHISALGGPEGGNGGFVQVSSTQGLDFNGFVDATAPAGSRGTLILDPAGSSGYAATLATDKLDYYPGETVTIMGHGWQAGENVSLILSFLKDGVEDIFIIVTTDANGYFSDSSFTPQETHRGVRIVLRGTGQSSSLEAEITFTDAARTASVSGTWESTATWGGQAVPTSVDDVTINAGISVNINSAAVCNSVIMNNGATFSNLTINGTNSLTVTGAFTMNIPTAAGTSTFSVGAGTVTIGGTTTLSNTTNTAGLITRITLTTGTINFNGAVSLNARIGRLTNAVIDLSGGAGTVNFGLAGTVFTTTNGTFTAGTSSTAVYNNAAAQAVGAFTYNKLTLASGGTKTTTGVTVNGILSMEGTATASAAPTYGASATLQYNTATARTAGVEWITPFVATGGVIIANTGTITFNAAKVFNADVPLTINSGATLNTSAANNYSLTFGGNFVNNGGTLTANASAVTIANTGTQNIGGFTTTGTVSMTKTAGVATLTGAVNGGALTINGTGGTLNLGTGLTHTFTGTWTRTAGTLDGGSSTLKIGGNASGTGATFTAGTGTVEYTSATAQTIAGVTYNNLTFSGAGGASGATAALAIQGNLTNTGGGTLNFGANAMTLSGTAVQSIAGFTTTGALNMTKTGGTATFTGNVNSGALTINGTGGTLNLGAGLTHQVTGAITFTAGTLDGGSSTLQITGNFTGDGGTFTASTGTISMNGSTGQTINRNVDIIFNNLIITDSAGVTLNHATGTTTVNGTVTLSSGTFTLTTALTLGNGATITRDTGTFSVAPTFGTSVNLTYIGNANITTGNERPAGATVLNNLTVNKSGGAVTLAANTTVNGNLTISAGTLDLSTLTADRAAAGGTLTVSNGGTLKIGGTNTIPSNYTTHSIGATGTIEYSGTNQSVALLNSSQNYGNLVTSGSGTKTLAGAIAISTNLTIGTGTTLAMGANAVSVGGNFANSGAFSSTGTVTFNGTAAQTIAGGASSFSSVTIANTTATVSLITNSVTITGTLTINTNAKFNIAGQGITLNTLANNGTFQLFGSETPVTITNMDTDSGTVEYYGNDTYGSLVAGLNYFNLLFSGKGKYTMINNVNVLGNITFTAPGYSYYKTITVQAGQVVGGPLTDFPMLFSVVDPDLRTVANNGYVTNASGYDIIFTDSNSIQLAHEIEKYDPVTGQLIAWVKAPSINNGTLLYIYYGNGNVTTSQENVAGVWSNSYKAVFHLDSLTPNVPDSTANAFNGTNVGATSTAGKIDAAIAENGNDQYIGSINIGPAGLSNWTESAWVSTTDLAAGVIIDNRAAVTDRTVHLHVGWWAGAATTNGFAYFSIDTSGAEYGAVGNTNIANGAWHYLTGVRQGTNFYIYVDGILQGTNNMTIGPDASGSNADSTKP